MQASEERVRFLHRKKRWTVFTSVAGVDLAPEVVGDELHPVTDAEHGDARTQSLGVDLRGARVIDARGASAEDQTRRVTLLQLRPRRRAGHQLAVDIGFADAARDQLAELGAEVEHENRLQTRASVDFFPPCRGGLAQDLPMPTCWAC